MITDLDVTTDLITQILDEGVIPAEWELGTPVR